MALEGTIQTPLGAVSKKTALIAGGLGVVVLAIGYYRAKKADIGDSTAEGEINPATGYPYGSAEDAAELMAQAAFIRPEGNTGGGGGSPSGQYPSGSYSNNAQWVQAVIEYMMGTGVIDNPATLSEALGKYITGAAVTDAQRSLIEQAIAVQGFPPVAGNAGYPPSINQQPVPANPPPTNTPPPVTPPASPPWTAPPTIRQGSRGGHVTNAQQRLRDHGFSPGPIDGIFGPKTATATRNFQRSRGLTVDAIIGPKTWAKLYDR